MGSGFDPRDLEREMGIDDESLRRQYGPQVNIPPREQSSAPYGDAPHLEQVVIPPSRQIPHSAPSTPSVRLRDRFGVSLRLRDDLSGPHRYTRAITYTLPFVMASAMMSLLLVPMTSITWYLVLVAFGRYIPLKVYGIFVAVSLAIGVLGIIALRLFPWLYGMV